MPNMNLLLFILNEIYEEILLIPLAYAQKVDYSEEVWDGGHYVVDEAAVVVSPPPLLLEAADHAPLLQLQQRQAQLLPQGRPCQGVTISAANRSIGSTTGYTITEKAPTRAFS